MGGYFQIFKTRAMEIGIIGYGRFGKLLAEQLSKYLEVFVYDEKNLEVKHGVKSSLEQVCEKDMIIPAVPISKFEDCIKRIKDKIRDDALVIDVCSVKEHPVNVMKKHLPKSCKILATHPLFGPDSIGKALKGKKIVLCKVRIDNNSYDQIKLLLENLGFDIIEASAEEHDKVMASSQALTHFVGRALLNLNMKNHDLETEGCKRLISILEMVENDSWELFEDMHKYNRFSKKAREDFIKSINDINRRLEK